MKMRKIFQDELVQIITGLLLLLVLSFCFAKPIFAYWAEYPPYSFKNGPFPHLASKPLVNLWEGPTEYRSVDKKIYAKVEEPSFRVVSLLLKDGDLVLAANNKRPEDPPYPYAVYQIDLNGDGLNDFIVFWNYRGNGLAATDDRVEIFLRRKDGGYQKITFDTIGAGLDNFVDLNHDGKYEIIVSRWCNYQSHTYAAHSIYEFEGTKLINAYIKFDGFPKFIWFTNKLNDKETKHLTAKEKAAQVRIQDKAIEYRDII